MPSVSKKQRVAMAIACHAPSKGKLGIPREVACEYNRHDRAKTKKKR